MNRFLGPASLGVSLLALGVALWGPHEAPPAPAPAPAPHASLAPELVEQVDELETRIKLLEDNALNLSRRMMALEQGGKAGSAAGGAVAAPAGLATEVEQLRAEVRGLGLGQTLHSEGGRQYFKEMLTSVQEEQRGEQREARRQRVEQAQAEQQAQRAERLRRFVSEARLSSSQERQVTSRLDQESTQRQALFEAMQSGDKPFQNARQEMRQLREQTDTDIKALLDDSQRAQYDALRSEEWQRGRPRDGQQGGAGPRGERGARP
jgi:hypothetical protein